MGWIKKIQTQIASSLLERHFGLPPLTTVMEERSTVLTTLHHQYLKVVHGIRGSAISVLKPGEALSFYDSIRLPCGRWIGWVNS
ncbi:MAG: hypothetical protein ABIE74_12830 [Pseudomonadota bacterium]